MRYEQEPTSEIMRDSSGLVIGFDDLIGRVWSAQTSDDPKQQNWAAEVLNSLDIDTIGDDK